MTILKLFPEDHSYIEELFKDNKNLEFIDDGTANSSDILGYKKISNMRIRSHGSLAAKERIYENYFPNEDPLNVAMWAMWVLGYKWRIICKIFNIPRTTGARAVRRVQRNALR